MLVKLFLLHTHIYSTRILSATFIEMSMPAELCLAQLREELAHVEQQVVDEAKIAEEKRVATEVKAAEEVRLTEKVRIAEEVEAERKSKEVEKERQAAMVLAK